MNADMITMHIRKEIRRLKWSIAVLNLCIVAQLLLVFFTVYTWNNSVESWLSVSFMMMSMTGLYMTIGLLKIKRDWLARNEKMKCTVEEMWTQIVDAHKNQENDK